MLSLEELGSLGDSNQRILFLKQVQNELNVETEPTALSETQEKVISQIFSNHAKEELVSLSEPEKFILRYILASASDQIGFNDTLSSNPSLSHIIKFTGFYELKKLIDTTYGNELRDIEPTPSILNDGRAARPNMTLRVRTALSIIMSRTFNKPVDASGLEVKGAMLGITKLANQLAGPIRLTLVAQNAYPNIESAKKGSWASVRPQIKKNYSLMLESQVLNLYYLPISRCQNMWLANYYLCKAFNLKR